jgi:hypothetical protein
MGVLGYEVGVGCMLINPSEVGILSLGFSHHF